jgi:hypothetical protein
MLIKFLCMELDLFSYLFSQLFEYIKIFKNVISDVIVSLLHK